MSEALEKYKDISVFDVDDVLHQVKMIHQVFNGVMKKDIHYGTIPGTQKPTLYKAGAEKINFMFRLAASYECEYRDLDGGHREVIATCTLTHIPTGLIWGQAVGSCSTMEGKYRFRTGEVELTDKPVPKDYWTDRDIKLIGGKGHATKKDPETGKWMIAIAGKKVEHDNPADYHNTVLKMAQKRAGNSAVIGSTAASDIFTVDLEDMPEVVDGAGDLKQKPDDDVVDVTPEDPPDTSEEDWKREEEREAAAGTGPDPIAGKIADAATDAQGKIDYESKPPPKTIKVSKQRGNILFAKLMNIPDYSKSDRDQILSDLGVKSVYEVPDMDFEMVKNLLDSFYKNK